MQNLFIDDFSGGLNLAAPEENIANNEFSELTNFEYNPVNGGLKTADGLLNVYTSAQTIDSLFYDEVNDKFVYHNTELNYVFNTDLTDTAFVGILSGLDAPMYCKFGDEVAIASGGVLQIYDGTSLTDVEYLDTVSELGGNLIATIVTERAGRLVIANNQTDILYYSGIGDPYSWNFAGETQDDAKWLQVGYKDGGYIVGIVPLSSDLLVFKSNGKVFRVINEYPDWVVVELSRNSDCVNKFSCIQVMNDAYFLGPAGGLKAVSTVQEYGAMNQWDAGYKINPVLLGEVDINASLYYIPLRKQVWIVYNNTGYVYLWSTLTKAFTKRMMVSRPTGIVNDQGYVYISRDTNIFRISPDTNKDNGVEQVCTIRHKKFTSLNSFLVKRIVIGMNNINCSTDATYIMGRFSVKLPPGGNGEVVNEDLDIVITDIDPINTNNFMITSCRLNYRVDKIDGKIVSDQGIRTPIYIKYLVVEV